MKSTYIIIKKPVITEKSFRDAQSGVCTFIVDKKASKQEIRKEVEEMFKVHVKRVATAVVRGKKRLSGRRRVPVCQSDVKKARVKLSAGEKIDLFEVGEKK